MASLSLRFASAALAAFVLTSCASAPAEPRAQAAPAAPATLAVPGETTGTLAGAPYRLDVPENWNRELVMYLHGYEPRGSERVEPMPQNGFDAWLNAQGFAVAQSAYSSQGWAVAEAIDDNERLRRHVLNQLPGVERVWLVGHSMGGHLALATLERHGEHYSGGLSLCGINASAEEALHHGALSPLVAFDHYFPEALQLGAAGLADPAAAPFVPEEVFAAALAKDAERAQLLGQAFGIRREDLAGALMLRYLVLRELIDRAGGFPFDTRDTRYSGLGDDAAFNAAVRRYAADPAAAAYVSAHARLRGEPGAPVLLLSNAYDQTVPDPFADRYVALAAAAGRSRQVRALSRQGEGHCNFDLDTVAAALGELRGGASGR